MADKKISELTELTTPDGTEELVVNDSGTSKKITQTNLLSTALPLAGGTMTGDVSLGDGVKATFGASDDLQISHSGSNSVISDTGTGNLIVRANDLRMTSYALEHNFLQANESGAVTLYHNNGNRLATTSTGIDVTGSVTCDGFTSTGIDDNATSTAITIDASENVGIGTTPAPWSSAGKLEVSGMGTSNQYSDSVSNAYYNSGWKYKTTGGATNIERNASSMYFRVAPSGTADSTISWTTALTITNDGRGLSQFTAKAWCHYEDDGGSDFNSHNISSITVVSTGKYTANFTNSMANTLYSAVVFNEDGSGYNDEFYAAHDTADARSVSQYGFWTGNIGPNSANTFNLMVFGD